MALGAITAFQPEKSHHRASRAQQAPEPAASIVAGKFIHSLSRQHVMNSLLPSAWKQAENPCWHWSKTEAMGILLDSVTANACLERGRCWEALAQPAHGKTRPVAGIACLGLQGFLQLRD